MQIVEISCAVEIQQAGPAGCGIGREVIDRKNLEL